MFSFGFDLSDLTWHHVYYARSDVDDMIDLSDFKVAYLARYGRQSMLQWDDVPVSRINRLYNALRKLMKQENDINRISED